MPSSTSSFTITHSPDGSVGCYPGSSVAAVSSLETDLSADSKSDEKIKALLSDNSRFTVFLVITDSPDRDCSILIRWKIPGDGTEEIDAISVQKEGTIQNLGKSEKNVECGKDEPSLRGERIDHLKSILDGTTTIGVEATNLRNSLEKIVRLVDGTGEEEGHAVERIVDAVTEADSTNMNAV